MGSRPALVRQLVESGLIAVVRARSRKQATPIALALRKGGIRAVEITMTTPDAIGAIADITRNADPSLLPGAGTVLDIEAARRAIDAGARFVVSPDLRPEVVKVCHERNIPVLMGAFTPTEMQRVHESGSDFVKFFPADFGGAAHVKAVRAPPAPSAHHPHRRREPGEHGVLPFRRMPRTRRGLLPHNPADPGPG